jgi:hypothetical protein
MIRTRFKKVLLISPENSPHQLDADHGNVTHIHALDRIFPSIFELSPNLIVFDYNYLSKDIERIVRRIRTNTFYSKIKICCYKTKIELKTDSLLKAIGVDYFVYEEELQAIQNNRNISHVFTDILDKPVLAMLNGATN